MENYEFLQDILNDLYKGSLEYIDKYKPDIGNIAFYLLNRKDPLSDYDVNCLKTLLEIGNITYNNTDLDILPIEDGMYDLLLEKYKLYNKDFQIGAIPIDFQSNQSMGVENESLCSPFYYFTEEENKKIDNLLFPEIIQLNKKISRDDFIVSPFVYEQGEITKRKRTIAHEHPELVGSLDKCKYTLTSQAVDIGVDQDSNVKIFERDWYGPMCQKLNLMQSTIDLIATIKYDGVSVEADVTNVVQSARTRGDANEDIASDITPILKGYIFPNAPQLDKPIGMKFEAIMTYPNLQKFNEMKGYNYINARTAIIGLFGSSDAYLYRDLITLVPLQTDLKDDDGEPIDRLVEIEFMNKYYCKEELLRYSVLTGDYVKLLFMVKTFVEEAEFSRIILPFMYDGTVFEFYDSKIRKQLGRKNSINQYAMAVKFNPLKKQTIFRGYYYTIGQDGSITPMAMYDPIEFLGAGHNHSTISSYDRFMKLGLRIGNLVDLEYVGDVMPYLTKPNNSFNEEYDQSHDPEPFITHCPSCGSELMLSKSGKTMSCNNMENCPERNIQRVTNMLSKLDIKDFAEETVRVLKYNHLHELMNADVEDFAELGETNKIKLKNQLDDIKITPMPDYKLVGSLGFNGIGAKKWKLIFEYFTMTELFNMWLESPLVEYLTPIKGVGPSTAEIIEREMEFFQSDFYYIMNNCKVIDTKGSGASNIQIRFTNCTDPQLIEQLSNEGIDIDRNAGVTKKTSILLIPFNGFDEGKKVAKAKQYGVRIVPIVDFKNNMDSYITI